MSIAALLLLQLVLCYEHIVSASVYEPYRNEDALAAESSRYSRFENYLRVLRYQQCVSPIRGGSAASRLMAQSSYSLHGEGDTEGREIGSTDDPYSVASISASPPKAAAEIERMYLEVLHVKPDDIVVRNTCICELREQPCALHPLSRTDSHSEVLGSR
jgi:hypothetical protein